MNGVEPKTLQEAVIYFSDQDVCLEYVVVRRWPNGVTCPTCGSAEVRFIPTRRVWECKTTHPKKQFSAKTGTICEDSPLGLDKWLLAMWMVANCRNGVSSYEIHRTVGVTQKTAWFLLHRIREAMQTKSVQKKMMAGEVEADESFIGGRIQNMHKKSTRRIKTVNSDNWGKTVVLGLLERETGEVRAKVSPNRKKREVQSHIRENVAQGAALYTDDFNAYVQLTDDFAHQMVNHLASYVQGRVHTNGMENFWSLLKRTLGGTYISVDPHHLFRYLDEQCFRFNKRLLTDAERLSIVVSQIVNRRLTYEQLTSGE